VLVANWVDAVVEVSDIVREGCGILMVYHLLVRMSRHAEFAEVIYQGNSELGGRDCSICEKRLGSILTFLSLTHSSAFLKSLISKT